MCLPIHPHTKCAFELDVILVVVELKLTSLVAPAALLFQLYTGLPGIASGGNYAFRGVDVPPSSNTTCLRVYCCSV